MSAVVPLSEEAVYFFYQGMELVLDKVIVDSIRKFHVEVNEKMMSFASRKLLARNALSTLLNRLPRK